MSPYGNPAPAGHEVLRSRYDITVHQGIEAVPNHGIEVVPNQGSHGVEVVPNQDNIPYRHGDAEELKLLNTSQPPPGRRQLCGLSLVAFWAWIVIIGFVLIGAAIGGGVGAGLAAQRRNTPNTASYPSARQVSTHSYVHEAFAHRRSGAL